VACATHACVHGRRLGDHPLDGESLPHSLGSRLAHLPPQAGVSQHPDDGRRHRGVIARLDQQSVDAVFDDLRNAAGARRDDRPRARHRVEQGGPEAFGHRAHDEEIETLHAPEDVGAKAGQQHVLFEMVLLDEMLELFAQLAFAEDDEARVGNLLHDQMRGLDEMALAFMWNERRDVADHRRLMRQPERFVHVDRQRGHHMIHVDALVDRHRLVTRHAVADEHLPDGFGRGDETVHLPVLPARERVAAEMKVHAPRGDERRRSSACSPAFGGRSPERERQRCHRDGVRVVGVNHIGREPLHDARETPRRGEIHLGTGRQRNQLEAFRRPPPQLAVGMRDECRTMANRAQAVDGQQHLILAAAPGSSGINVKGKHS